MTDAPFRRVLIANRGEIAVRVARACREAGSVAIAVYGPGEENAVHVRFADDAWRIPSDAPLPYLDIAALIAVARQAKADAIHPGYGFLAENAAFAAACAAAGLTFIGPSPAAIRAMGDKVAARALAVSAGVPIAAGSDGPVATVEDALREAARIGYPVAVKAAGGGGGRGFRVAATPEALPEAFAGASGEAARSFANPDVYLERYLARPRHVEIQLMAGPDGEVVILGERDCSIQRRHQKLIEETPSPGLPAETRAAMGAASAALARAVGYQGAGTVEFLVAADGSFAFLEMNTRIQVEHPVTELVTGIDLVKEQLWVAAGRPLSFRQADVAPRGHAIECRINAEDPGRGFAPAPGRVSAYRAAGGIGVRVESASETGTVILPTYDSLIAKLAVWGRDREEAIARMTRALGEFQVTGVPTTIPFHRNVMANPAFAAGDVSTSFLTDHPEVIPPPAEIVAPAPEEETPATRELLAEVNGRRFAVRVTGWPDGATIPAARRPRTRAVPNLKPSGQIANNGNDVISPIQGTVLRLGVAAGQQVRQGETICVVEAMKMENDIAAPRDGTIAEVLAAAGAPVAVGDVVARLA